MYCKLQIILNSQLTGVESLDYLCWKWCVCTVEYNVMREDACSIDDLTKPIINCFLWKMQACKDITWWMGEVTDFLRLTVIYEN